MSAAGGPTCTMEVPMEVEDEGLDGEPMDIAVGPPLNKPKPRRKRRCETLSFPV